jgi:DNA-binding response OmpR family regulator
MKTLDTPVLICDYSAHLGHLLSEFLVEYGFQTIVKCKIDGLIDIIISEKVDIVLLDVELPDGSGLDLLREIKATESKLGRHIRVIILTAVKDPSVALKAMSFGAYYFFTKPIVFRNVIEQIEIAANEISREREKVARVMETGVLNPSEVLDQVDAAKEQPEMAAVRFPFNRLAVLQNAPETPGVITLRDKEGKAIFVEWVENISVRLTYFVAISPIISEQCRYANTFEYFLTEDSTLAGTIFDKLVNELGAFPRTMLEAPEGSKYFGKTESDIGAEEDNKVTKMIQATETKALENVQTLLKASPDDLNLLDWYAFLCYSHGRYEEAVSIYERLIKEGSFKLEHHFYLGNACYKSGDVKRAITEWRFVVKGAPGMKLAKKSAMRIREAISSLQSQGESSV